MLQVNLKTQNSDNTFVEGEDIELTVTLTSENEVKIEYVYVSLTCKESKPQDFELVLSADDEYSIEKQSLKEIELKTNQKFTHTFSFPTPFFPSYQGKNIQAKWFFKVVVKIDRSLLKDNFKDKLVALPIKIISARPNKYELVNYSKNKVLSSFSRKGEGIVSILWLLALGGFFSIIVFKNLVVLCISLTLLIVLAVESQIREYFMNRIVEALKIDIEDSESDYLIVRLDLGKYQKRLKEARIYYQVSEVVKKEIKTGVITIPTIIERSTTHSLQPNSQEEKSIKLFENIDSQVFLDYPESNKLPSSLKGETFQIKWEVIAEIQLSNGSNFTIIKEVNIQTGA